MSNQHSRPYTPRPIRMEDDTRQALIHVAGRINSTSIRACLNHIAYLEARLDGIVASEPMIRSQEERTGT